MMIDKIKAAALEARKNRDEVRSSLFVTLTSDIEMIGKNGNRVVTDTDCIATIKKYLKGIAEILKVRPDDERALLEKSFLEDFLPKQLSEDELTAIMQSFSESAKNMGEMLKLLKASHDGQYDGATASRIAKTFFN